ncbi:MAG: glycosyltransferase [Pyrinomonadaceae bacterium]|nr:glycosyltransferase [Pyrinomonadaceae bacterium]
MPKSLYVCYFGLREPLVQTQVIPYLKEILKDGVEISLLTFEPEFKKRWTSEAIEAERRKLAESGITWHATGYHKSPSVPATFFDIVNGTRIVRKLLASENYDILHCRVHLPALMAAIARTFSKHKPKILFDIRGFFPEEYTDAGVWPEGGWLYRTAKRVERWLLKESDGFVVLTEKARDILFPESITTGRDRLGRPVEVIPCCIDTDRFARDLSREGARRTLGVEDRFVIVYVGSLGGWYLTDEMIEFFAVAKETLPNSFILILTQRDRDKVSDLMKRRGFSDADFIVKTVEPSQLADELAAGDIAISFIKRCYSKQSSSPTKIGEYLACGLPIVANRGVGDIDSLIESNGVGVLIDGVGRDDYVVALDRILQLRNAGDRCRETADLELNMEKVGGHRYRRLYKNLLSKE